MIIPLWVPLLLSLPPGVRAVDEANVQRLVAGVESYMFTDPPADKKFRRAVRLTDVWRCLKVRASYSPVSVSYRDISFAAAYYNIDYTRNVRRLFNQHKLWLKGGVIDADLDGDLSSFLQVLYLHQRNRRVLRLLLGLKFDGVAAETYDGIIEDLFAHHAALLVAASVRSPSTEASLANELAGIEYMNWPVSDPGRHAPTSLVTLMPAFRRALTNKSIVVRGEARRLLTRTKADFAALVRENANYYKPRKRPGHA